MILNWKLCKDELPEKDGRYATAVRINDGNYDYLSQMDFVTGEDGGWNCYRDLEGIVRNTHRIDRIVAWADLAPFKAMVQKELDELHTMMEEKKDDTNNIDLALG